ncbi:MAG: hypothetical protein V9F00_15650 [Nocardioides sp.]
MRLVEIVEASREVAATRSRKAKVATLAAVLARADDERDSTLVEIVASWLGGSLRQRRTGVGYRSLSGMPAPAAEPTLTVVGVDGALEKMAGLTGSGSSTRRIEMLTELMGQATEAEQGYLRGLIAGEVRQGALDSLVQEAAGAAAGLALADIRRAAMMAGSTPVVVAAALTGGQGALAQFRLTVGRPVLPMLASSAPGVAEALVQGGTRRRGAGCEVGRDPDPGPQTGQ